MTLFFESPVRYLEWGFGMGGQVTHQKVIVKYRSLLIAPIRIIKNNTSPDAAFPYCWFIDCGSNSAYQQ